jgi:hypothetical protein
VRQVQRAGAEDEEAGTPGRAAAGVHRPGAVLLVPRRAGHLLAEADVAAQVVVVGEPLEVVADLRLR